ncbi:MAG: metal-dependent transcriptional regulator, partial [Limisphaerales bacterium]
AKVAKVILDASRATPKPLKVKGGVLGAAQIPADHVHEDAEKIEHVLGEDVVRQLEKRLDYATKDPHGRDIPGLPEIEKGRPTVKTHVVTPGYGRRK